MKRILPVVCILMLSVLSPLWSTTHYISPTGNNSNDGLSQGAPKLTFANLFASGAAGDEFVLLDGAYKLTTTGCIEYTDAKSDMPPSGTSTSNMTFVHALNAGKVNVETTTTSAVTPLWLGRTPGNGGKRSFIKIQGIYFIGGGALYNTDHIYISSCGFYQAGSGAGNAFGTGTIDGNWGNTFGLFEDIWVRSQNRLGVANYRSDYNVWRRVVIKNDGCGTVNCTGSGNPNVGFTVYNSSHVSIQNMFIIDTVLGGGFPYADFAAAQHNAGGVDTGSSEYWGANEWLGCIAANSENGGYSWEADDYQPSTFSWRAKNIVSWKTGHAGFNWQNGAAQISSGTLDGFTIGHSGNAEDAVRIIAGGTINGYVQNGNALYGSRYGINSSLTPSFTDVFGSTTGAYNTTSCAVGCKTTDPRNDTGPSLKYLVRVEAGSALSGAGRGGADMGATIVNAYGTTGTFYDEVGYNVLTGTRLWGTYPNNARLTSEMCRGTATAGYCSSSFEDYLLGMLGNSNPYSSGGGGGGGTVTYTNWTIGFTPAH